MGRLSEGVSWVLGRVTVLGGDVSGTAMEACVCGAVFPAQLPRTADVVQIFAWSRAAKIRKSNIDTYFVFQLSPFRISLVSEKWFSFVSEM